MEINTKNQCRSAPYLTGLDVFDSDNVEDRIVGVRNWEKELAIVKIGKLLRLADSFYVISLAICIEERWNTKTGIFEKPISAKRQARKSRLKLVTWQHGKVKRIE